MSWNPKTELFNGTLICIEMIGAMNGMNDSRCGRQRNDTWPYRLLQHCIMPFYLQSFVFVSLQQINSFECFTNLYHSKFEKSVSLWIKRTNKTNGGNWEKNGTNDRKSNKEKQRRRKKQRKNSAKYVLCMQINAAGNVRRWTWNIWEHPVLGRNCCYSIMFWRSVSRTFHRQQMITVNWLHNKHDITIIWVTMAKQTHSRCVIN